MASPFRRNPRKTAPKGPWKAGPIPVIGVVGGIGSGKSAVSAFLEARGAFLIDADKVGHALLNQNPVRDQVIERFGRGILEVEGVDGEPIAIDRRILGKLAFSNPAALADLESILHPRMRLTFEKAIARTVRKEAADAVVLDAAILFEAGWDSLCDRVLFVNSPREQRLKRVIESRGWTEEVLDAREAVQLPLDRKRHRADHDIDNRASMEHLKREVDRAWKSIRGSVPSRASRNLDSATSATVDEAITAPEGSTPPGSSRGSRSR